MKKLLFVILLGGLASANMHFEKNQKCSSCHPQIFKEYKGSQHGNATVFKDKIHGAVYDKHPQKLKKDKYRCGKCHTPTADNLSALLKVNNGVIPDPKNETQNEAVACAYCHRIEDVVGGKAMNKNIISNKPKVYFSSKDKPLTSPFHGIETKKDIFKDGKLCMGCHARKSNKKGFDVCATDATNMTDQKNCISCHMPKVAGSASIMNKSKEHTYHGFPGLHGDLTLLSKYVTFDLNKSDAKFVITVNHDVSHPSSLHPLRMSKLVVSIERAGKITKMKPVKIFKVIGAEGKPSPMPTPPWLATQIIKDTRLMADSKKDYSYDFKLQKDDKVTVKFGHLLVKPKALKKFGLENNEEATKFRVLSKKTFIVGK